MLLFSMSGMVSAFYAGVRNLDKKVDTFLS
jgi:hypothetical protein